MEVKIAIRLSAVFFCLFTWPMLVGSAFSQIEEASTKSNKIDSENKESLKGKVEEAETVEILKGAETYDYTPNSKENDLSFQKGLQAPENRKAGYLEGRAQMGDLEPAKEDPDADDKELMIAWDRWRNRFLQAVLGSTTEMLNNDQVRSFRINSYTHVIEPVYPIGTTAWFVCEVTRDRQIKRLRILTSSGYADYDKTVLDAVQALQGSSILRFPTGSRRMAVLQGGAVERAAQRQQQYFRFGDIERYRVPAY